jgi:hypothetical protein
MFQIKYCLPAKRCINEHGSASGFSAFTKFVDEVVKEVAARAFPHRNVVISLVPHLAQRMLKRRWVFKRVKIVRGKNRHEDTIHRINDHDCVFGDSLCLCNGPRLVNQSQAFTERLRTKQSSRG